ncbi:manganese/zinc/iron transport system permease protein [Rubricella aquisinus]|uniref:Manganese/zinc/iron transport system permease protein n=1 Tax=Rubricella aquisinus TaxID=2028108 RepID=A0A840X2I2_9RHOB|nr:metal ABC transporter permease [Rubricella aquisinus]MBB5517034.1 manganese/zinc/iron transport system permease protein [Rubricella aquisinus]
MLGAEFVQLSLTPMLIGILSAVACALPGNFLLLRRQALIGDAISHVVLPGIVVAFVITGTITAWPMMIGAGVAALVAVGLIEVIKRLGRVEPGAAMGLVFTTLFAAGVLLLERTDTSAVHIDVDHALMGSLESLIWFDATGWGSLLDPVALAGLPPQLGRLLIVTVAMVLFLRVMWRGLVITTFDPGYARAIGLPVNWIGFALVVMTAIAAVAAFDAVGSIIVIAMFVCPPAAARLMTNRLVHQIWWSVGFAVLSAILGYILAGYGPGWIGAAASVSAAGMIATVSGVILALACLFAPERRRAQQATA